MTYIEQSWTKTRREIGMVDRNVYRLLPAFTNPDDQGDYWTCYKWNSMWMIDAPAGWGRFVNGFPTLREAKEFVEQLHRSEASDAATAARDAAAILASDAAARAVSIAAPIGEPTVSEPQKSATADGEITDKVIMEIEINASIEALPPADSYWNRETRLQVLERRMSTIKQMEAGIPRMVHHARAAGASWADVGQALGVSLQAAHKRYAEHPAAPSAMREAIKGEPLWDDTPTA